MRGVHELFPGVGLDVHLLQPSDDHRLKGVDTHSLLVRQGRVSQSVQGEVLNRPNEKLKVELNRAMVAA